MTTFTISFNNTSDTSEQLVFNNIDQNPIPAGKHAEITFAVIPSSTIPFSLSLTNETSLLNLKLIVQPTGNVKCVTLPSTDWDCAVVDGMNVCSFTGSDSVQRRFAVPVLNPIGIMIVGTTDMPVLSA